MAETKHGEVAAQLPDHLALDERAGKLQLGEVLRLSKPPRGVGLVAADTADAGEKAGDRFQWPKGVTPEGLRAAADRADGFEPIIVSIETILHRVKQGNLIADHELWLMLRKVNKSLVAQMEFDPELTIMFSSLRKLVSRANQNRGNGQNDVADEGDDEAAPATPVTPVPWAARNSKPASIQQQAGVARTPACCRLSSTVLFAGQQAAVPAIAARCRPDSRVPSRQ